MNAPTENADTTEKVPTKEELRKLAEEKEVEVRAADTKPEIIEKLEEAEVPVPGVTSTSRESRDATMVVPSNALKHSLTARKA